MQRFVTALSGAMTLVPGFAGAGQASGHAVVNASKHYPPTPQNAISGACNLCHRIFDISFSYYTGYSTTDIGGGSQPDAGAQPPCC